MPAYVPIGDKALAERFSTQFHLRICFIIVGDTVQETKPVRKTNIRPKVFERSSFLNYSSDSIQFETDGPGIVVNRPRYDKTHSFGSH